MKTELGWAGAVGVAITLQTAAAAAAEFHVAPDGSPSGDGSSSAPWDLETALAHPASVQPGDTIWLHDGTYEGSFTSVLAGTDGSPIVVRAAEQERPRIDGASSADPTLTLNGSWTWYWGFEVTNSEPDRWGDRPAGMGVFGPNLKLINLVLHDLGNNGFWTPAENLEICGCLIYHNGYDDSDRGHGHGVYTQNDAGTKRIVDNIIFGGYSFGVHAYTEGGSIRGFEFVGNTWFNAGVISSVSGHKDDCLVGGLQPAARIALHENMSWARTPTTRTVRLGYSAPNEDVTLTDNYVVGETNFAQPWSSITMTGNTFYSAVVGVDPADYPENDYLTARPSGARLFVRPNPHEPGRAHITVYNWDDAESVDVDLGEVLNVGDGYAVHNAQNFFAAPVATGTYDGSPVSLPMGNLEPAPPVGTPGALPDEDRTGTTFNVFVLLPAEGGPIDPRDGGVPDGGTTDASADDDAGTQASPPGAQVGEDACSCRTVGRAGAANRAALVLLLVLLRRQRRSAGPCAPYSSP